MFVAFDLKGNSFNVAERQWSKQRLRKLRDESVFICPTCRNEVELKIGSVVSAHFAHKKLSDCPSIKGGAETQYHLKGKLDLFNWLQRQDVVHHVQLEPFLPDIKQRPDLLFTYRNKELALEYQCSTIEAKLLHKRSQMYKKAEIPFIWILGGKSLKRTGATMFQLSPFQWRFVLHKDDASVQLFAYCAELKSFIILQNIIPFSNRTIFADQKIYPLHSSSFTQVILPSPQKVSFIKDWFRKVKVLRLQPFFSKSKQLASFHQYLYKEKQIPLSYLPSYAFLPLRTNHLIESPVYVWQGWIIVFIDRLPLHSSFTFKRVCDDVALKIRQGFISVRSHLLIDRHFSFLIKEYLIMLSELFVINQMQEHVFRKEKHIKWPSHLEELLSMDDDVMQIMLKSMNQTIRE